MRGDVALWCGGLFAALASAQGDGFPSNFAEALREGSLDHDQRFSSAFTVPQAPSEEFEKLRAELAEAKVTLRRERSVNNRLIEHEKDLERRLSRAEEERAGWQRWQHSVNAAERNATDLLANQRQALQKARHEIFVLSAAYRAEKAQHNSIKVADDKLAQTNQMLVSAMEKGKAEEAERRTRDLTERKEDREALSLERSNMAKVLSQLDAERKHEAELSDQEAHDRDYERKLEQQLQDAQKTVERLNIEFVSAAKAEKEAEKVAQKEASEKAAALDAAAKAKSDAEKATKRSVDQSKIAIHNAAAAREAEAKAAAARAAQKRIEEEKEREENAFHDLEFREEAKFAEEQAKAKRLETQSEEKEQTMERIAADKIKAVQSASKKEMEDVKQSEEKELTAAKKAQKELLDAKAAIDKAAKEQEVMAAKEIASAKAAAAEAKKEAQDAADARELAVSQAVRAEREAQQAKAAAQQKKAQEPSRMTMPVAVAPVRHSADAEQYTPIASSAPPQQQMPQAPVYQQPPMNQHIVNQQAPLAPMVPNGAQHEAAANQQVAVAQSGGFMAQQQPQQAMMPMQEMPQQQQQPMAVQQPMPQQQQMPQPQQPVAAQQPMYSQQQQVYAAPQPMAQQPYQPPPANWAPRPNYQDMMREMNGKRAPQLATPSLDAAVYASPPSPNGGYSPQSGYFPQVLPMGMVAVPSQQDDAPPPNMIPPAGLDMAQPAGGGELPQFYW